MLRKLVDRPLADPGSPHAPDLSWPVLRAAEAACDSTNPMTGRPCILGYHQGYHRDFTGAEWLDDE